MTLRSYICIILLISGCTSHRYILDTKKTSFSDLLNGIEKSQNQIESLRGKSRISIETLDFSGSFFADILYNKNDSLLINVSGPFGIDLGKLFLGERRFIFYNQFANQFYSGVSKDFMERNFLQFPLKIKEIAHFFIGKETINNMKILSYKIDADLFFINGKNGSITYNIWIDHISGHIKKIEYIENDIKFLVKEYDKISKFNDTYFPKYIKLSRPAENQVISVFYNKLILNEKILSDEFNIKISDSARQIDLNLIESQNQENI